MLSTNSYTTTKVLKNLFSRFGIPDVIASDNGPPFTSEDFQMFCRVNGIRHILTAPYHPASNGAADNSVFNIKSAIIKTHLDKTDADLPIDRFLFHYRITPHYIV